jgi:hypothetical protein
MIQSLVQKIQQTNWGTTAIHQQDMSLNTLIKTKAKNRIKENVVTIY